MPDLRAIVRARMAELDLSAADVGRKMAPVWGIALPRDAAQRLTRWLGRTREITSDDLALLLGALDLRVVGPE